MKSLNDSLTEYKKVNFNPKSLQSYDKFLQRLKTFELFKWFAKPAEFSPIECARHGWINLSKDTLKCVSCSNILYHHSQSALVKSFKINEDKKMSTDPKLLTEKHNQNCPWRTLSVTDQFIQVDAYDEEKVYKNFNIYKETYKKCFEFPILDDFYYQTFEYPENLIDEADSLKNITSFILSICGWLYNQEKDILQCEKCLRSIGLWLFKRNKQLESNSNEDHNNDINKENKEFLNLFGNTDILSNELIARNLLNKIINSIEIEQENESKLVEISSQTKKRKLNDSINESKQENISSCSEKKKIFDPINEHHSWCPWLAENDSSFLHSTTNEKVKKIQKNMCHLNYETLLKYLERDRKNENEQTKSKRLKESSKQIENLNSDNLLERVKSVQSILINCTSQFSLK